MRFHVRGADRQTGREVRITVDAATVAQAEDRACAAGLLVSSVELAPGSAPITDVQETTPPKPTFLPPQPATTPIEKTAKRWKKLMLVALLLMAGSVPTCMIGGAYASQLPADDKFGVTVSAIGTLAFLAGFGIYVYARAKAWWHHG